MEDQITVQKVIRKVQPPVVKYEVQMDDGSHFFVTEDVLVRFALLEGSSWTKKDLQTIHKAISSQEAYQQILRWLGRAPQAESTLREKLIHKGYSEQAIDEAIRLGKTNQYINDEEYAFQLVAHRISRGKGRYWIEQELRHLKIDETFIASALQKADEGIETKHAYQLAHKKWKQLAEKPLLERKHKTAQFLARRGYTNELIWKVIQDLSDELDNNQL